MHAWLLLRCQPTDLSTVPATGVRAGAAINGAGPSDPQYMELTARVTDAGDAEYRLDFERATSLNATRAARPLREVLEYMEDQIHGLNEGRQWGDEWTRFTSLEAPERR